MARSDLDPSLVMGPGEVRAFREQLGWSQRRLAHELGLRAGGGYRTVQNWEYGKALPPPMLRLALSALLMGVKVDRR